MYIRPIPQGSLRDATLIFTGGINEAVSNLELSPGELFDVVNYEEIDGQNFGYRSTDGFERTDGQYLASSVLLDKDFGTTPPTIDDAAREAERNLVTAVPAGGYLHATFEYNDTQFVLQSDGLIVRLYKTTVSGFSEVAAFAALSIPAYTGTAHVSLGRYSVYSGHENKRVAVICTGNNPAVILREDDTVEEVVDDPYVTTSEYPYRSYMFNDRLFLAFADGNLFFSGPGTPTSFDPAVDFAGVYYLRDEINDMITAPNSLLVFCEDSIHIIVKTDVNIITGVNMAKEVFNDQEGGIANTVQKLMGRIVYASKEGITTIDTTADYGDFEQALLTKKIQKTFDTYKSLITTSSVVRDKSQYRLYFSNGRVITLTFGVDKQVKGATILRYPMGIDDIWENDDNVAHMISNSSGFETFLYRRSKDAQSFDGEYIVTLLQTAFYHYKSPTSRKVMHRILTELDAEAGVRVFLQPSFNYANSQLAAQQAEDLLRSGATWNVDEWGEAGDPVEAVWGNVPGLVEQIWTYINGIGYNMSIQYFSTLKHYGPHTLHNAIVSYEMAAMDY